MTTLRQRLNGCLPNVVPTFVWKRCEPVEKKRCDNVAPTLEWLVSKRWDNVYMTTIQTLAQRCHNVFWLLGKGGINNEI